MEHQIKTILENCACLGRDAYGEYIDRMTKTIIDLKGHQTNTKQK